MTLKADGDDLDCLYCVVGRFIDGLRAGAPPVPKQVIDWCLKVRMEWEMSASGPGNDGAAGQSEQAPYTVAGAATKLRVTERHVRRLCEKGDIDATRHGRVWVISPAAVTDYMEGK